MWTPQGMSQQAETLLDLVHPGRSGREEVDVERGVTEPRPDLGSVVLALLSQTRWTSSPVGTALSIRIKNFLDLMARWRRCSSDMTVSSVVLKAANRLVILCRK
jgi:hypothetical protein